MSSSKIPLLSPIEGLNLNIRATNALKRAGISTIYELTQAYKLGKIRGVYGIGEKHIGEIELIMIRLYGSSSTESIPNHNTLPAISQQTNYTIDITDIIQWQGKFITKQITYGLLHKKAKLYGHSIDHWLSVIDTKDYIDIYQILKEIITSSFNIYEEINLLTDWFPNENYLLILLARYGLRKKTLQEIGQEIGVTRERVRQIARKIVVTTHERVKSALLSTEYFNIEGCLALLKMQSALHIARHMDSDITYNTWKGKIRSSGLVGNFSKQGNLNSDPIETMISIFNVLAEYNIQELTVPNNLAYAIQLAINGTPNLSAHHLQILSDVSTLTQKLIRRHTQHSGGVHSRWLSQETDIELQSIKEILQVLGYHTITDNWYVPKQGKMKARLNKNKVFHHALRKMFCYCEPLPIEDLCQGIRHAVSRTSFPAPSPEALPPMLEMYGYNVEDDLYYWDGKIDEALSMGETIILNCLTQERPVVHHSELAQAFIDSELSFPSLHATLNRSPLFHKIDVGLYKLRGNTVTQDDIDRAKGAVERVPVDLEIKYLRSGEIFIYLSLGILAIGTGVVYSEQLPNLSGQWDCYIGQQKISEGGCYGKRIERID